MISVSDAFLEKSASSYAVEPLLYLDIWPDKGPQRTLKNPADWSGLGDPASSSDVSVSSSRVDGSLVLASGSLIPLTSSPVSALKMFRMRYTVTKQALWETRGNWLTGKRLVHTGYVTTVTQEDASILIPFVANGSFLLDSLRILVANTGNSTSVLLVRILSKKGAQIGRISSVSVVANQAASVLDFIDLAATLQRGLSYSLELSYQYPAASGVPLTTTTYTVDLQVSAYDVSSLSYFLPVDSASGFEMGGETGYALGGSALRSLDVGSVPAGSGVVSFRDVVPVGTALALSLYYTDSLLVSVSSDLSGWSFFGVVSSGDTIPAHRYWRVKIEMSANAVGDVSPELQLFSVSYIGEPLTFGQRPELLEIEGSGGILSQLVHVGVDSVSTSSAQLSSSLKSSMIGRVTVKMLPSDEVHSLMSRPLRGRPCRLRVGYVGLSDTLVYYEGILRDMSFSNGSYVLTIQDSLELANVKVPRQKAGKVWDAVTAYAAGEIVVFGSASWLALQASTSIVPDISPNFWQNNGAVWQSIVYDSTTNLGVEWHLADIAKDLLINHINVSAERLDLGSFETAKAKFPSRTGRRSILKPSPAFDMLSEIAWLLGGQFVVKFGKLTLVLEPEKGVSSVEFLGRHDIAEGLQYRRGWADLKNEVLVLSDFSDSSGSAVYNSGYAIASADSIDKYDIVSLESFNDKWHVPASELQAVILSFLDRWKDGRRVVVCSVSMRMLRLEVGDVVTLKSSQLPLGDTQLIRMMIIRKDLNWQQQSLKLSFMEVF